METRAGLGTHWEAGRTPLGAWMTLREPLLAEHAATIGYDFVCVDMQHGFSEFSDAATMFTAIARGGATPIARVPWNEPGLIGRVIDAGSLGVIIPMVNNADQARAAAAACKYAPIGARSFGPHVGRIRYGADYFSVANGMVSCLPMVETIEAVDNIDGILAVPGVDGVYLGPADLSVSVGLPPSMNADEPVIAGALARVLDACARHGKIAGIHATPATVEQRQREGYRMLTVGGDIAAVLQALQANLTGAREAMA
jgi:4-hydroxy-2-oxoheptanedioate aldolase